MKWLQEHWMLALLCFVIGLIGTIFIVMAFLREPDESQSQPAPGPSPSVSNHEHSHEDEMLDDGLEYNDMTCKTNLDAEEYSAFVGLIRAYEEAYQSPPSAERLQKISDLTTLEYQAGHTVSVDESSDTLVKVLWDKSVVNCEVAQDGSRTASVRPTIQTSFINDSGEEEIIFAELTLHETHYSTWVLDNGGWKVSREF